MSLPEPFYADDAVALYHGDARHLLPLVEADVMVTDPPYGLAYKSSKHGVLPRSIDGDRDTFMRDSVLDVWGARPSLVFGTWKCPPPAGTRQVLVWDTLGALGMGDLSLPWKPSHQQIYVLGTGFTANHRGTDVLSFHPCQATAKRGRTHPHEKPIELLRYLIGTCPPGVIVDPFAGSGTTLRAAKDVGREAVGVELDERYCRIAADRMRQEVLDFGGAA